MRSTTSHAAKSGVGEHTARESEAPNVCVDPFRGDQKFPRSGERRKIGQPTKVSFASWIRSERYDPEGSRGPGGERTVEDKRRILSRELATGSGDDRAPLCIKAGRGREPKTERASDGLRIASKL
jgi:hypothetical protein